MGCLHSKKETIDVLHPNVFRVINIDECGTDLCSGQLEITESDIILYREGRDSTVWPLHSLRRYGFEGEIFSFESGRRCETGEGIYAFKCRRASLLFRTLQQQILLRNVVHESVSYPMSRLTPSPQGRQTVQASVVHRSSIDNSQADGVRAANIALHSNVLRNATSSRSPSSADILEAMPGNSLSHNNSNHITNIYQFRDIKREHNNNQTGTVANTGHDYCNDLNRDLAVLRHSLKQETALNTLKDIEDETRYLENKKRNKRLSCGQTNNPLSPTLSTNSERYAQLSVEQLDTVRLYMNVASNEINLPEVNKNDAVPTTPLTPKQVEYCNLTIGAKPELNTYANLSLGELGDSVKNIKQVLSLSTHSDYNHKFSESDTFTSMSPVEELEVNYAILDIDIKKEMAKMTKEVISPENNSNSCFKNDTTASGTSQPRARLVSQNSVDKTAAMNMPTATPLATIGYTTIDFDKTVALTSVASGTDVDVDGPRKTRHNSCNLQCGSPGSEKTKAN